MGRSAFRRSQPEAGNEHHQHHDGIGNKHDHDLRIGKTLRGGDEGRADIARGGPETKHSFYLHPRSPEQISRGVKSRDEDDAGSDGSATQDAKQVTEVERDQQREQNEGRDVSELDKDRLERGERGSPFDSATAFRPPAA